MKHFLIQFLPAGVEVSARQLASSAGFFSRCRATAGGCPLWNTNEEQSIHVAKRLDSDAMHPSTLSKRISIKDNGEWGGRMASDGQEFTLWQLGI